MPIQHALFIFYHLKFGTFPSWALHLNVMVKPLYSCAHIQLKSTLVQQGPTKNPMEKHGANGENLGERQLLQLL